MLILSLAVTTIIGKTASENSKINKDVILDSNSTQNINLKIITIGSSITTAHDFKQETTALDILKQNHKIKSKSLIAGISDIYCIDDVCASGDYFWAFYANGKPGNNPGNYIVKRSDELTFNLENKEGII